MSSNANAIIEAKNERIHELMEALEVEQRANNLRITELMQSDQSKEKKIKELNKKTERLQNGYDQIAKNYQVEFENNQKMLAKNNELNEEIVKMRQYISNTIRFCRNAATNSCQKLDSSIKQTTETSHGTIASVLFN